MKAVLPPLPLALPLPPSPGPKEGRRAAAFLKGPSRFLAGI